MIRLFRVFIPAWVLVLLVSETLLISGAFILAGLHPDNSYFFAGPWIGAVAIVVLNFLIGFYFQDLYSNIHVKSGILLLQQICIVVGSSFIVQGMIAYLRSDLKMPLRLMAMGSALSIVAVFLWRLFFTHYAAKLIGTERILLYGSSPLLLEILDYILCHPELGVTPVGPYEDTPEGLVPVSGDDPTEGPASLTALVAAVKPDRIVIGMKERRNRMPMSELLELRFSGLMVEEVTAAYERLLGRVCLSGLRPSQLVYSTELGPRAQRVSLQRATNALFALVAVIAGSPLILLTALAVRLTSPGPVLYRQKRVGLNGVGFTVYKFRSMRANAESETGAVWAQVNDPRVTPIGGFLRRVRLDEIPQLFNVLRGEMSLVGPRPERPEFVQDLSERIPYYRQRHCVRPGITGWAQISHKYGDTLEDTMVKLEYDLYYIKHLSQSLDTYIIFHTLKTMLLSRGAQ